MTTKQLRNKILDLAIHGRLVPQDANDEPASTLLARIRAEKEQLVKEGKLKKKDLVTTPVSDEDKPFEVPEGWEWVSFGEICNVVRGGSPRPAGSLLYYEGDIPFMKVADLTKDDSMYVYSATSTIKEAGLHKTRIIDSDTLVLSNSGATLGVPKITKFSTTINDGIAAFLNLSSDLQVYCYWFLKSMTHTLRNINQGAAQPNLNTDLIKALPIPLPPLAEQHRIVSAVEQWMSLVDIIESGQENLLQSIALAKNKILDLAIKGKLVPQDANDEPASVLLERIRKEKERNITERKIRLSKPEKNFIRSINNDFALHDSWQWCNLYDVCRPFGRIGFRGYTKEDLVINKEEGAITLSPSNIIDGKLDYSHCTYLSKMKYEESPEIKVENGDILLVKTASCGKTALVEHLPWLATINPQIAVLKDICINKKYLSLYLLSSYAQSQIQSFISGTAVPTFSTEVMLGLNIPLPPLSEQHRIVSKIEELFAQLDTIANALT